MPEVILKVGAEDLKYQVEAGPMPYQMVWQLAADKSSRGILEQAGYQPSRSDARMISGLMNRDASAITRAGLIAGRSIVCSATPAQMILGEKFNAINLSGWAYNLIDRRGYQAAATGLVQLPRADQNYRELSPKTTVTTVMIAGQEVPMCQPFLFPGAYTYEEIINKVGAELALWEMLVGKMQTGSVPFSVPVPLQIGIYSDLHDPKGRPAFWYASREPFGGRRNGIFPPSENPYELGDRTMDAIYATSGLRALHDEFGLVHNQSGMGNIEANFGYPRPHIADWATVSPIDLTRLELNHPGGAFQSRNYGRVHDLLGLIRSAEKLSRNFWHENTFVTDYVRSVLRIYLGNTNTEIDAYISQLAIDPRDIPATMTGVMNLAELSGVIRSVKEVAVNRDRSWKLVEKWRDHIAGQLAPVLN